MTNAIIEKAKERFAHTHESLAREFGAIRAGRANASLLDRITVGNEDVESAFGDLQKETQSVIDRDITPKLK